MMTGSKKTLRGWVRRTWENGVIPGIYFSKIGEFMLLGEWVLAAKFAAAFLFTLIIWVFSDAIQWKKVIGERKRDGDNDDR